MSESSTPPTVAVLGASRSRAKFGNKAVRAYLKQGYRVFPINPHADEIEGCPAYPDLSSLTISQVNLVSVYLPPEVGITLLDEIARLNPAEVWFNPGSDSPELIAAAEARNLPVVRACSIVGMGETPANFGESL